MGMRKATPGKMTHMMEVEVEPIHLSIQAQVPPTTHQISACALTPAAEEVSVNQKGAEESERASTQEDDTVENERSSENEIESSH